MEGENDLCILIKNMSPELQIGEYVFSTLSSTHYVKELPFIMSIKEKEGTTLIIEKKKADELKLNYEYISSWITLNVHSSLYAVGFLACVSKTLATQNISCNVVSGYFHDHIFVPKKDEQKAINTLNMLSLKGGII